MKIPFADTACKGDFALFNWELQKEGIVLIGNGVPRVKIDLACLTQHVSPLEREHRKRGIFIIQTADDDVFQFAVVSRELDEHV